MAMRLNLTLDDEHAALLADLAEAAHVQTGTLARSLLLSALDRTVQPEDAPGNSGDLVELLDRLPGAEARHRQGLDDLAAGRVVSLNDL